MTVPVECAAVVKGDAYGCGIGPVTRKLLKAGCRTFFVADVSEGRRVREIAPDAAIYVLNGLMPGSAQSFADNHLRPIINSTTELAEWDAFVATRGWRGGTALHVDTGMNRLGVSVNEAVAMAPRIQSANHSFTLLMSHFGCAEIPDHPMNDRQIRTFREIRIMYRGVPSSLANSSGIFLGGPCIATWCGRGSRSMAPIRRREGRTRCVRWSSSRAASSRCAPSTKGIP